MDICERDDLEMSLEEDLEEGIAEPILSKNKIENLKISIDNETDPDPTVTFLKLEPHSPSSSDRPDPNSGPVVTLALTAKQMKTNLIYSNKKQKKIYNNAAVGIFESGIDISSEDARSKREERAKRFGIEQDQQLDVSESDVCALYESLGVTESDLKHTGVRQIRTDTIMLRGVNDMSTDDIFKYLCKYPPARLEWIDDSTCNVIYSSTNDCNRALLNISRPIKTHIPATTVNKPPSNIQSKFSTGISPTKSTNSGTISGTISGTSEDIDDTIDLLTDVNNDGADVNKHDTPSAGSYEENTGKGKIISDQDAELDGIYMDEKEIPPGKWRVGQTSSQFMHQLFMRLATKADVKVKGAEKRSEYYRKYGNPNYGGMQGLISNSKKQRIRRQQQKNLEKEAKEAVAEGRSKVTYDEDDLFGDVYNENEGNTTSRLTGDAMEIDSIQRARKRDRSKLADSQDITDYLEMSAFAKRRKPAMRMAADEEEEKISHMRAKSVALIAAMDVRNVIKEKQKERINPDETDEQLPPTKQEPIKPDLRTRLSRRNDWYS